MVGNKPTSFVYLPSVRSLNPPATQPSTTTRASQRRRCAHRIRLIIHALTLASIDYTRQCVCLCWCRCCSFEGSAAVCADGKLLDAAGCWAIQMNYVFQTSRTYTESSMLCSGGGGVSYRSCAVVGHWVRCLRSFVVDGVQGDVRHSLP